MNYIVLDLEWNQSNTGLEPEVKTLPFEIIEIGAIKLNKDFVMTSEFSELVRPTVYKEMHQITSKLIHMKMEELERGALFPVVYPKFMDWCGEQEFIFCTWGPLDLTELQRNIKFHGLTPISDGPIAFLDIQKLFSLAYEDGKSRRSLEYAIDSLGLEKDIPFHRAFSDAYYTAKILATLNGNDVLQKYSYDIYCPPKRREDEIKVQFDTYMKYISREFPDRQTAFEDKEVISCKCYLCHKNLRKKIKWFTPNGRNYYCVGFCNKHGNLKAKLRVRKTDGGGVYIVKTTKLVSEHEVEEIQRRRDRAMQIRQMKRAAAKGK